jgi:hypothetical protein
MLLPLCVFVACKGHLYCMLQSKISLITCNIYIRCATCLEMIMTSSGVCKLFVMECTTVLHKTGLSDACCVLIFVCVVVLLCVSGGVVYSIKCWVIIVYAVYV